MTLVHLSSSGEPIRFLEFLGQMSGNFLSICYAYESFDLGPAPVDRKLDANTEKSIIRYINKVMTANKLNQQKAGPMSPVSEETKADSIGLPT